MSAPRGPLSSFLSEAPWGRPHCTPDRLRARRGPGRRLGARRRATPAGLEGQWAVQGPNSPRQLSQGGLGRGQSHTETQTFRLTKSSAAATRAMTVIARGTHFRSRVESARICVFLAESAMKTGFQQRKVDQADGPNGHQSSISCMVWY